jgi:hypothetical protein
VKLIEGEAVELVEPTPVAVNPDQFALTSTAAVGAAVAAATAVAPRRATDAVARARLTPSQESTGPDYKGLRVS